MREDPVGDGRELEEDDDRAAGKERGEPELFSDEQSKRSDGPTLNAVVVPTTVRPRLMSSPAPRKPMPCTTPAATRDSPKAVQASLNMAEPRQPRPRVRLPASWPRNSRSKPGRGAEPEGEHQTEEEIDLVGVAHGLRLGSG